MCACIISVCLDVHMCGGNNQYVCMYVGKHAHLYVAKYVCMETCMITSSCVYAYMYACACMFVGRHA